MGPSELGSQKARRQDRCKDVLHSYGTTAHGQRRRKFKSLKFAPMASAKIKQPMHAGHTIAANTVACLSGITSSLLIGEDARTQAAAREKAALEPTDEYVCFEHQYHRRPAPCTAVSKRYGCSKSCNLRQLFHPQEYGRKLSTGEPIANFARISRDLFSTKTEEIQAPVNTVACMSGITPSLLIGEDARTQAAVREEAVLETADECVCFEHQYRLGSALWTAVSNSCSKSCDLPQFFHAQTHARKLSTGEPIANFVRSVPHALFNNTTEIQALRKRSAWRCDAGSGIRATETKDTQRTCFETFYVLKPAVTQLCSSTHIVHTHTHGGEGVCTVHATNAGNARGSDQHASSGMYVCLQSKGPHVDCTTRLFG